MALYKRLAQHYIDAIEAQKIPPGSRLPALRVLAKLHQVSVTTATKAYEYLQQHGWVYAQPQSGYFVAQTAREQTFPTVPVTAVSRRDPRQFSPRQGYDSQQGFFSPLGVAMIAPELQPMQALQRSIKRVTSRSSQALYCYPLIQGEAVLRQSLARHFRQDNFAFSADNMVITNGCIEAVRIAIETVTKVGDTIAISSPCFSGLLDLLAALSRHIIEIPCCEDGLDLALLERCFTEGRVQAGLFSTSHMNPTGHSLSNEQKQQLAQLANDYQIAIIEDDVYAELSHQGRMPLPAKYWDKDGYIFWCGSFSKTLAAGLRIGWCLPGRYLTDYLRQYTMTSFGVNGLMQQSLADFINNGDYRRHIHKTRQTLSVQLPCYRQFLIDRLPNNTKVSVPDGGTVLWLQVPGLDVALLERRAQQQRIDIRSGHCFSTHDYYRDCFRINAGWPLLASNDLNTAYGQLDWLVEAIPQYIVGTVDSGDASEC